MSQSHFSDRPDHNSSQIVFPVLWVGTTRPAYDLVDVPLASARRLGVHGPLRVHVDVGGGALQRFVGRLVVGAASKEEINLN